MLAAAGNRVPANASHSTKDAFHVTQDEVGQAHIFRDKGIASERQNVGDLSARGVVDQVPLLQLCSTDMRLLATW
jgi:hypothetical protein